MDITSHVITSATRWWRAATAAARSVAATGSADLWVANKSPREWEPSQNATAPALLRGPTESAGCWALTPWSLKAQAPCPPASGIWINRVWRRFEILSSNHEHPATMSDRAEISARLPHLRTVLSFLPLSNPRPGSTHVRALPDIAKQLCLGFEREWSPPTHNI